MWRHWKRCVVSGVVSGMVIPYPGNDCAKYSKEKTCRRTSVLAPVNAQEPGLLPGLCLQLFLML
jgi:hypothetical protein